MAEVRVKRVRLYAEERGRGEPIVCIQGTASSAMVWRGSAVDPGEPSVIAFVRSVLAG
jgi:hypothetical protein